MVIEPIYCLFMLTCFHNLNQTSDFIRDSKGNQIPCPKGCECYSAPSDGYSPEMDSFSMICTHLDDNLSLSEPVYLNTIVYKQFEGSPNDKFNSVSMVLENVKDLFGFSKKNSKYVTIYRQDKVVFYFQEAEFIHIQDSNFLDNYATISVTQNYPNLRSLTIKSSKLEGLDENHFFGNAPLQIMDLSHNNLVNSEPIFEDAHNEVRELYLNNNRLTSIPPKLANSFPNLDIFHLQENLIQFVVLKHIMQPLPMKEFILFTKNKEHQPNKIFNYDLNARDIENNPNEHAMGLWESFAREVEYTCLASRKMNWNGFKNGNCPAYKTHPGRYQRFVTQVSTGVKGQTNEVENEMNILGLFLANRDIKINRKYMFSSKLLERPFGVFMMNIYFPSSVLDIRNMIFQLQATSRQALLVLNNLEKLTGPPPSDAQTNPGAFTAKNFMSWIQQIITDHYSVMGFVPISIGAEYAGLEINVESEQNCPLTVDFTSPMADKLFQPYNLFVSQIQRELGENTMPQIRQGQYMFIVNVDIKAVQIMRILMSESLMVKCFQSTGRIDGINVVNIDPDSEDFQKQITFLSTIAQEMRDTTKMTYKKMLILTYKAKLNEQLDPRKESALKKISPNLVQYINSVLS